MFCGLLEVSLVHTGIDREILPGAINVLFISPGAEAFQFGTLEVVLFLHPQNIGRDILNAGVGWNLLKLEVLFPKNIDRDALTAGRKGTPDLLFP